MFDSHCHWNAAEFDADRFEVLARARALGVQGLLIPAVRAADFMPLSHWCRQQPDLYPAWGLHPLYWREHQPAHLEQLSDLIRQHRPVAVGEIGLDFWPGTGGVVEQQQLFTAQLALAQRYSLPVVLHLRKAVDAVLLALKRSGFEGIGVLHAFNGSAQQAQAWLDRGFYFGVGGGITYPRAQQTRARAVELPLERLLLETDAPDMPLQGRQGQRNSPEYVLEIAQTLAALRAIPVEQVIAQTTANARRLFALESYSGQPDSI